MPSILVLLMSRRVGSSTAMDGKRFFRSSISCLLMGSILETFNLCTLFFTTSHTDWVWDLDHGRWPRVSRQFSTSLEDIDDSWVEEIEVAAEPEAIRTSQERIRSSRAGIEVK